jgi:hypothetical protein
MQILYSIPEAGHGKARASGDGVGKAEIADHALWAGRLLSLALTALGFHDFRC